MPPTPPSPGIIQFQGWTSPLSCSMSRPITAGQHRKFFLYYNLVRFYVSHAPTPEILVIKELAIWFTSSKININNEHQILGMEKVESNLLTFQISDFVGIFVSVQLYVLVVGPALPRVPLFVRLSVFCHIHLIISLPLSRR